MAMLPVEALRRMRVLFATPCYVSAVTMNYVTSIWNLAFEIARTGLPAVLHMHSESLITRGRNKIAMKLLEGDFTHLFFIDADIVFEPAAVMRLLLADRDVAAGVYPMKTFNWPQGGAPAGMSEAEWRVRHTDFPFNPIGHGAEKVGAYVDEDGFVEVAEAPTGFMCVKRGVFERLMQGYPQLKYTPDGPPGHPLAHLHWRFFDCMPDPDSGRYLSEDFAFCRLWRDLGGKVFVDVDCKLGHLGQFIYEGNLYDSLRGQGRW
jgi:hypothetical protein